MSENHFDVVVSFSSLQYMRFEAAIAEVARVLRIGGCGIFMVLHGLGPVRRGLRAGSPLQRLRNLVRSSRILFQTVGYPLWGRLFSRPIDPVYPFRRHLYRWLKREGLYPDEAHSCDIGDRAFYVARKLPVSRLAAGIAGRGFARRLRTV